jgi:hypothetical protein
MTLFWRASALIFIVLESYCLGSDPQTLEPGDGVLVLRNGSILQGRITPVNDMFLVTIGENGEVRLPRAEVEFQCRDLDEAYLRQRNALVSDTPAEHLELAEWCLRHGLLARASDQLLVVLSQEPGHPRLGVLEQRLNALGEQALAPSIAEPPRSEPSLPVSPTTPKISPQLMQQFTTIVQPILLNRCAAYACHGRGSEGKYRLIRPLSGNGTTSRMTRQNLQATRPYMDLESPEKSRILEQANIAHGGAKSSPFADKHAYQFSLLANWVQRAAASESIATNRGGPQRSSSSAQTPDAIRFELGRIGTETAVQPASAAVPDRALPAGKRPRSVAPLLPKPNAASDPLDPEIFNRQYHPARRASGEEKVRSGEE